MRKTSKKAERESPEDVPEPAVSVPIESNEVAPNWLAALGEDH